MFLILVRNISCLQQMFPSLRNMETQHSFVFARPRNIMSNNVSATMCPRLPVPLQNKNVDSKMEASSGQHLPFLSASELPMRTSSLGLKRYVS